MNPTLLGFLFAAAPIAYDIAKRKPRKRKSAHRRASKHARRRSRR